MAAFVLRALHVDGTEKELPVMQIDLVRFEANFSISWGNALKDLSNTQLLWLAHTTARRLNVTTLEFEPWLENIDDVRFEKAPKK